ncbi:vanadium-dependent haloperoxidase [Roseivivax sp. CAU 1761]
MAHAIWRRPATRGDDEITLDEPQRMLHARAGDDLVTLAAPVATVLLGRGDDTLIAEARPDRVHGGAGDDVMILAAGAGRVAGGRGDDRIAAEGPVEQIRAGRGDDVVTLAHFGGRIDGGRGIDHLELDWSLGSVDCEVVGEGLRMVDRFTGAEMIVTGFESVDFADASLSAAELAALFDPEAAPAIHVGGGTQVFGVNGTEPTVSVVWDRVVQQAVIEASAPVGPTVAARAYAMVHTAMFDAWASYDPDAVRVSFDREGDNLAGLGGEPQMIAAMSHAAFTVLSALFPESGALFERVMTERYGLTPGGDGSLAAEIGIDAAEDLLWLRAGDGANQAGGYADISGYVPVNSGPDDVVDIARWTPESAPVDPEGAAPLQTFLTPHWRGVEGFGLAEDAAGATDFSAYRPAAPEPFFSPAQSGATLDMAARTITLAAPYHDGVTQHAAGATLAVDRGLIGPVINPAFIAQAEEVIAYSAGLTDRHKIIAEFWEDGAGTAFPPGTFMAFGHFVSARDGHDTGADAVMFLALANAMLDAGIATWDSKVAYDYARPVRAIRDLGELGLIGEWGTDALTGETGYVIEAFGGFDAEGYGRGTQTVLAENFVTFQRPGDYPSPPFAEYTSGHSAFSAAGAEVLRQITGSDAFGGTVRFAADSIQFERNVPATDTVFTWDTFTAAADEAGLSRLYGGIHFSDGDLNGRALGRAVGADAVAQAERFVDGTASDADRPFWTDIPLG